MAEAKSLPTSGAAQVVPRDKERDRTKQSPLPLSFLHLPPQLRSYASGTDRTLLRLNALLSTSSGLEASLTTLEYLLHLIAAQPTTIYRLKLSSILSFLRLRTPSQTLKTTPSTSTSTSTSLALSALVSNLRLTLRLTALLPLYARLRFLLNTKNTTDPLTHRINLAQCTSYIIYQFLENVAHLIDLRIFPPLSITLPFRSRPKTPLTASPIDSTRLLWRYSNRFYLAAVTLDFVRLFRQAVLEREGRTVNSVGRRKIMRSEEEEEAVDRKWWSEFLVAGVWWPLGLHWSLEGGLRGVRGREYVVGLLGVVAGWEGLKGAWVETSDV